MLTQDLELLNDNVCYNTLTVNRVLDCNSLTHYINQKIICNQKHKHQTKQLINHHIIIDSTNKHYFADIQTILGINKKIVIHSINPDIILWDNCLFKRSSNKRYYKCSTFNCGVTLSFDQVNHGYHLTSVKEHVDSCQNYKNRLHLIHDILKQEMYDNIKTETAPNEITPRMHYRRIIQKYDKVLPLCDLSTFPPFEAIESALYKRKNQISKLTATTCNQFFTEQFESILQSYAPSKSMRENVKPKILWEANNESVFLTRVDLLKFFFESPVVGGDGTFNIRPQFVHTNGGRQKLHSQVFKVYAYRQHQTNDGSPIILSYLIGVALLEEQKAPLYKWLYKLINQWGHKYNITSEAKLEQFIHDFEKASRNEFSNEFSDEYHIKIRGEEFHYAKSIFANVQHKGLVKYYVFKKKSANYDCIFRQHVELLYNIIHIPPSYVQRYAILIMKSLWNHVKSKYKPHTKKKFMAFIVYFLVGWCELEKNTISKLLNLKGRQIRWCTSKKTVSFINIEHWNLYQQLVTNSNAIEVNNKHDRQILGYYPTINFLVLTYLRKFDDVIRRINWHRSKSYLANSYRSKKVQTKKKILKCINNQNFSFEKFLIISASLTLNKYKTKYYDIKMYYPEQTNDVDLLTCDKVFNKNILDWYNNHEQTESTDNNNSNNSEYVDDDTDNESSSEECIINWTLHDTMEMTIPIINNGEEYLFSCEPEVSTCVESDASEFLFSVEPDSDTELNKVGRQNTSRKRKINLTNLDCAKKRKLPYRKVRQQLQNANFNPYQEYSSSDDSHKWANNMTAKIRYEQLKQKSLNTQFK